jgi:hypothetical protein
MQSVLPSILGNPFDALIDNNQAMSVAFGSLKYSAQNKT